MSRLTGKRTAACCAAVAAAVCLLSAGCYDANAIKPFLNRKGGDAAAAEYKVYPPDVIAVQSVFVQEINGLTQQVRPDGNINLPLLGEVYVAGKTPGEIEKSIRVAAKEYYDQVDVTVNVVGYNSQNFYVLGQVGAPGPMPWTGRDTLLEVLARAQPTQNAWPERIAVIRPPKESIGGYIPKKKAVYYQVTGHENADPNKQPSVMTVNYVAMVTKGDMSKNILLQPNDIVYVEANPFAKVTMAVNQVFGPVRAINYGFSDYREIVENIRWVEDGMPRTGDAGQQQLIVRP
jgi:polysaccharide export outer membrane protein